MIGPAHASTMIPVIGLRAGWTSLQVDDYGTLSDSAVVGISGGVRKGPFEIELAADHFKTTHQITVLSGLIVFSQRLEDLETDFSIFRLMVAGKYHFPAWNNKVDFYIGGGGGGYFPKTDEIREPKGSVFYIENIRFANPVDIELKNVYGAQALTGLDYRFTPNIQGGLEYRILLLQTDLVIENPSVRAVFPTGIFQQEFSFSLKYLFK